MIPVCTPALSSSLRGSTAYLLSKGPVFFLVFFSFVWSEEIVRDKASDRGRTRKREYASQSKVKSG